MPVTGSMRNARMRWSSCEAISRKAPSGVKAMSRGVRPPAGKWPSGSSQGASRRRRKAAMLSWPRLETISSLPFGCSRSAAATGAGPAGRQRAGVRQLAGRGSRILGLPVDAERIGQLIDRDDQRAGQDQMARPRAGPRTQRPVGLRRQAVGLHAMADDRVGAQVAQVHMRAGGIGHREMRVRAVLAVGARPRALAPEGLRLAGGQALVVQRVAQQFARAVVRDVQLARHRIHADVAGSAPGTAARPMSRRRAPPSSMALMSSAASRLRSLTL